MGATPSRRPDRSGHRGIRQRQTPREVWAGRRQAATNASSAALPALPVRKDPTATVGPASSWWLRSVRDAVAELARLEAHDLQARPELVPVVQLMRSVIRTNGWQDQVDVVVDSGASVRSDRRALARILVDSSRMPYAGVGRARVRIAREGRARCGSTSSTTDPASPTTRSHASSTGSPVRRMAAAARGSD